MNYQKTRINFKCLALIIAITVFFISGCEKGGPEPVDPLPGPTGPTSKTDNVTLSSKFIGESYPLRIFLPAGYETKNLPVIYLLDGKFNYNDFIVIASTLQLDAIIVAIGEHGFNGEGEKRSRDFRPGYLYDGKEGGHLNFYNFLNQEVVPYIDKNYENDHSSRSLVGYSSAGLFTLFTLLNQSPKDALFSIYLAGDPEGYSISTIREMTKNLEYSSDAKSIKLYISQTTGFPGDAYNGFFEEESFPWLTTGFKYFENEEHENARVPSFEQGLKFLFNID